MTVIMQVHSSLYRLVCLKYIAIVKFCLKQINLIPVEVEFFEANEFTQLGFLDLFLWFYFLNSIVLMKIE